MADHISQSAPLASIVDYLVTINDISPSEARQEASQIMHNFERMKRQGYIDGWYFDEQGHLSLIPSDDVLHRLNEK
ncbi:MAG: hypothetical protein R3Y10_11045 [Ferrimonas sp.]